MTEHLRGALVALAAEEIGDDGRQWIEVMPTADRARNGPWLFTITRDDLETYAQSIRDSGDTIHVDYDHAGATGGSTAAAGWFTGNAEVREAAAGPRLWAEVEWTPQAREDLKSRRFRFISPEFSFHKQDGATKLWTKAKAIVAATLTNRPFFKQLAPVGSEIVRVSPASTRRRNAVSTTQVDPASQRLHDGALAILAERNRCAGRAPDDYTADQYVAAVEEVQAEPRADILDDVLREFGVTPETEQEVVTEQLLQHRSGEILLETGASGFDDEGRQRTPTDEQHREAARQAIRELGKPGERRKDLAETQAACRERMVDDAVAEGRILASAAEAWKGLLERDQEQFGPILTSMKPLPGVADVTSGYASFDPTSFETDLAVKAVLRAAALIDDKGGESYDSDDYVIAWQAVETAGPGQHDVLCKQVADSGYTRAVALEHANEVARGIARKAAEAEKTVRGAAR